MPGKQMEEGGLSSSSTETQPDTSKPIESDAQVAEALQRVQAASMDMKEGDLQASLEAAIEMIDSARETSEPAQSEQLDPVADALEGALDELENGKIANLQSVIEEAQSIIKSDPSDA